LNSKTRIAASVLGIYAGLLGIEHGIFEIRQGNIATNGLMINAMGPGCQPETVWHACFPALTLLPNYLITGILAIIISLIVLIWAVGFVHRRNGGWRLMLFSALLIPVGGGFIPAFLGIFAGAAGTRIYAPLPWWQGRSPKVLWFLSKLWPWLLILLVIWSFTSWILGYFFNQPMLSASFLLFICFDLVLPLLIVSSAIAYDVIAEG